MSYSGVTAQQACSTEMVKCVIFGLIISVIKCETKYRFLFLNFNVRECVFVVYVIILNE